MMKSPSNKVGPYAGATSKQTLVLRDQPSLTRSQIDTARRLRRKNIPLEDIARIMGVSLLQVSHACAGMRTPRDDPPRGTLNVSMAAHAHVMAQKRPGEPIWETVNRLLGIV
jgi:hypothetical protein